VLYASGVPKLRHDARESFVVVLVHNDELELGISLRDERLKKPLYLGHATDRSQNK